MWNRKVFVRIIEVLLCIACVVALRVTDDESRRVFHYLRNRSLEWSLLSNVTWGSIGAALASATCGGYIVVTVGLLIAAARGELRGRATEIFFLGLGVILFGIVGALSMASIESVPQDLVDNAAVFGALCLITALVFIADMLMKPRYTKKEHNATQTISSKEQAKQYVTTTTMTVNEKDKPRSVVTSWRSPSPEMTEKRNSMNDSIDDEADERDHHQRIERSERQMREYAQNIENGRGDRSSRSKPVRDRDDMPRKMNGYYREDIYQRPVDEVDDTPPFPTNGESAIFTKVVNPSVKIMRVERDNERGYDNYRLSDTSQYDNVPTRMRGSSPPGTSGKRRDAYSVGQPRSRDYHQHHQQQQRDHRMRTLEDCFDELRTSTMTTQADTTIMRGVSSMITSTPRTPNDPGFVRHAASNWPRIVKKNEESS